MKKFFFLAVAFTALVSFSSCKKCSHCEYNSAKGASYCEKDNQTAYDQAKVVCEGTAGKWVND